MSIESEVFKRRRLIAGTLSDYGFVKEGPVMVYTCPLTGTSLHAEITVDEQGIVRGNVYDEADGEAYTTFRLHRKLGSYAASVKKAYMALLEDIAEHCYQEVSYIMPQTIRITERITEELDGEGEQIFEDDELTVFRHEHKKWYALISVLERSKITAGQGEVEILNVKLPEDRILELLPQEDYYPAWHMNKKHWLTVILDDSLDDDTVMDLIKTSYILTSGYPMRKTRHWIVPANPRYYDLIDAFHQSKEILWKQSSAVQTGDLVYIYYGSPYSALMFKTKALKVNIPYDYEDVHVKMRYVMKLRLIESYPQDRLPLKKLKDYGITTVRGPRYMPSELFDDLEKHKV